MSGCETCGAVSAMKTGRSCPRVTSYRYINGLSSSTSVPSYKRAIRSNLMLLVEMYRNRIFAFTQTFVYLDFISLLSIFLQFSRSI